MSVKPSEVEDTRSGARRTDERSPDRRKHRRRPSLILLLPAGVFLTIFFVVPIVLALLVGFFGYDPITFISPELTLSNYARFLGDAYYLTAAARTFGLAALTTILCAVVGYVLALHLFTLKSRWTRTAFTLIILFPLMLSLIITAFAWTAVIGDSGMLNRLVVSLGLTDKPLKLEGSLVGVAIVMAYQFIPYFVLNVYAALENIPPGLERAAQSLGASSVRAFRAVTFPLSMPGVVSGTLLVFALSLGAFITPLVIGRAQVQTLPVFIYNFAVFIFDWPGAAALAGILILLSFGATYGISVYVQRRFMTWREAERGS